MPERYFVWAVIRKLATDGFIIHEETLRRWETKGKIDKATRDILGRRYWTPKTYPTLLEQVKHRLTK